MSGIRPTAGVESESDIFIALNHSPLNQMITIDLITLGQKWVSISTMTQMSTIPDFINWVSEFQKLSTLRAFLQTV